MKSRSEVKFYSRTEENINIYSHAVGIVFGMVALFLVMQKAFVLDMSPLYKFGMAVYGVSLVLLYSASTLYHSAKEPVKRMRLRVFDHAAIYLLIAGTYTPYVLITLHGKTGWWMFGISWGFALVGVVLKMFFTGRLSLLSTLMYVFMGWLAVFVIKPLMNNLSPEGLFWLAAGGIAYTVGAIIYSIKKIPYNHAVFHIFVLIGSFCHFLSIYWYV